jgi:hypothetical protein
MGHEGWDMALVARRRSTYMERHQNGEKIRKLEEEKFIQKYLPCYILSAHMIS